MIEHADAFIARLGGYGTVDETCNVLSRTYLGIDNESMILLNVNNYLDRLLDLPDSL